MKRFRGGARCEICNKPTRAFHRTFLGIKQNEASGNKIRFKYNMHFCEACTPKVQNVIEKLQGFYRKELK